MKMSLDEVFREAVTAIDSGDVRELTRLIAAEPRLVRERLESPGSWLRSQVGDALDGFFARPYLLWFIAEDPVRNGSLPGNIAEITRVLTRAAESAGADNLQEQLDYALQLVCWSRIAAECNVQIALIDALLDAGASPLGAPDNALVNGNKAAATHLIGRGAPLSLTTAVALARWDEVATLLRSATARSRQNAFIQAALHGNVAGLKAMLEAGVEISEPSADLFSHATALHHAVSAGSLEAVRLLVEAGAEMTVTDTAYGGTPLGWAEYAVDSNNDPDIRAQHAEIRDYLRSAMPQVI